MQVQVHVAGHVDAAFRREGDLLQLHGAGEHGEHLRGLVVLQVHVELHVLVVEEAGVVAADHVQPQVAVDLGGDDVARHLQLQGQFGDAGGDALPGGFLQVAGGEVAQLHIPKVQVHGAGVGHRAVQQVLGPHQVQRTVRVQHEIKMSTIGMQAADVVASLEQVPQVEADVEVLHMVDGWRRGVRGGMEAHILQVDADGREALERSDVASGDRQLADQTPVRRSDDQLDKLGLARNGDRKQDGEQQGGPENGPEQHADHLVHHGGTGGDGITRIAGRKFAKGPMQRVWSRQEMHPDRQVCTTAPERMGQ